MYQIEWHYQDGNFHVYDSKGRLVDVASTLPIAENMVFEFEKAAQQGVQRTCSVCGANAKPFQDSCSSCGQYIAIPASR